MTPPLPSRPRQRGPESELALTQDKVVEVALSLLRRGGLEQVSMRKIAARLGVRAQSIYWHVESKEALCLLMGRSIFQSCLDAMPRCTDWRQWLREYGLSLWRSQCITPDIRQLILAGRVDKRARDGLHAVILDALVPLGLAVETAQSAQQSVQALVTGWTTIRAKPGADPAEESFRESLDVLIDGWGSRVGR
jgi:TetR/AcrR family tetracycline transcriptional repressor